jgi:hypothetical protein
MAHESDRAFSQFIQLDSARLISHDTRDEFDLWDITSSIVERWSALMHWRLHPSIGTIASILSSIPSHSLALVCGLCASRFDVYDPHLGVGERVRTLYCSSRVHALCGLWNGQVVTIHHEDENKEESKEEKDEKHVRVRQWHARVWDVQAGVMVKQFSCRLENGECESVRVRALPGGGFVTFSCQHASSTTNEKSKVSVSMIRVWT